MSFRPLKTPLPSEEFQVAYLLGCICFIDSCWHLGRSTEWLGSIKSHSKCIKLPIFPSFHGRFCDRTSKFNWWFMRHKQKHIVVLFRPFFSNHPINIQESHQHDFDPHKTPSRNYAAHPVDVAFLIPAHPDFIVDFHILKVHWHTAQGLVASAGFFKQSVKRTWQKQGFSRGSFWCCRFLDIGLSVQSIYINVPISTKSQTLKKQNINFIKQSVLSPKSAFHKLDKAPETRSSQAGHRAHQ